MLEFDNRNASQMQYPYLLKQELSQGRGGKKVLTFGGVERRGYPREK